MGDLVNAVADIFGLGPASKQAKATERAAQTSADVTREQLALQQRMYEEGVTRQAPWLQAGQTALNQLIPAATSYTPFGMTQFQQDPGYQFRLSEGLKALDRQAAARGGLISGGALKAAQRYGQEMASGEYTNAFNRYQAERQARLGPLQSLAGVGQTTAQALTGAGQTYGALANQLAMTNMANQGNLALQLGNVRASQYGTAGSALNRLLAPSGQAAPISASTGYDVGGFGTGAAYGNQDYGAYL